MSVIGSGEAFMLASGDDAYTIERSLRFQPGDSPGLSRSFTHAGNRRTWTFSCWVKRSTSFNSYRHTIASGPGTTLSFSENAQGGADSWFFYVDGTPYLLSNEVLRDTAAWYHVVFVFDTTNATAADRCRLYKNGVRVTSWRNTAYPAQNFEGSFNTAGTHKIGYGNANETLDGYLADVHFIDGQALDPSSFGETHEDTGVWTPIKYKGAYGNNGFKLVFDPVAGLGKDSHGGVSTQITTSNITAASTSSVSLGGSSTGNNSTSQSEVNNAFDNNTSTFFGFSGGGSNPDQIKEWTFSTGLPVKAGDVVSYEGSKGAGFKAGVFLANGQVVGGNYPYPNVDSVTASSDTTITKINAGSFGGGNQYSNIKKLTINGVAYPLSATELTLTDTTGLSSLNIQDTIQQTGGSATGVIYRISGSTVDLTQTTNTWGTGTTAEKPSAPIENDFTASNLTTSVQSVQSSAITAVATVNTWNQDKIWSNFVGGPRQGSAPWSNAFNGSIHSAVDVAGSTSLNQSFTGVTSFRFATVINQPVTISGTGITTQTWSTAGWKTVTLTSTSISNIVVSPGPGESMTYPSAFEVNGEILVDQGVSGNQVVSNTLTLTDTTNLSALSVGDVVYPGNKQITAINTSTPSIVVNGGAFQVGGVVSKPGTFGDDVIDSPTDVELAPGATGNPIANYATLNSVAPHGLTLNNGNLDGSGSVIQGHAPTTIYASSGKFYCEFKLTTYQADTGVGVAASIADPAADWIGEQAYTVGYLADGRVFQSGAATSYSSYAAGDTIGVAFDATTGKVWFHKNGVYLNSGNPAAGTGQVKTISGGYALGFTFRSVGGAGSFNFGQRGSFDFALPTGFKALCTENLDDPLITKGSDYFDILTWAGDGPSGNRTITGLNMADAPDWVWAKERNGGSSHATFDSVRGFGSNNVLCTNNYNNEGVSNGGYVNSTTKTSVTFAQGTSTSEFYDANNKNYVAWCWDGGDLATNSAYNQDRVWSDGVTFSGTILEPATKAFDGNSATSAAPYDGANGGGTPQWVQVTFNPGVPYTSSVKVERQNGNPTGYTVSMNGGTAINSVFQAYTTVATGSGTLTSIKVQNNGSSNTAGISRIEVDGKVLVDKGVIPAGSLNSSFYDSSQNWSSNFTSDTGFQTSAANAFDGSTSTESYAPGNGAVLTMTFNPALTGEIEIDIPNGGAFKNSSTNAAIGSFSGRTWTYTATNLPGIKIEQSGGGRQNPTRVKLNGKILVDPTATPPNVPSAPSTCRTNRTAGFSIVSWQGSGANASIGHNLNAQPAFMIVKVRNSSGNTNWCVYHKDLTSAAYTLALDSTYFAENNPTTWNSTDPTSSVFFTGTRGSVSENNKNIIGYIFSEVEGYSSFGKANTTGTAPIMCYTGFAPRWVLIKDTTASGPNWLIFDTERDPDNLASAFIRANSNLEEIDNQTANGSIDFLSNGFSIRASGSSSSNTTINIPNSSVVWAAFAEHPFKNARAK